MATKKPLVFDVDAWVRDTRGLSLEARAIWIDLLTEMHRNVRRGYLCDRQGTPWTPERTAAFCGCSAATASRVTQELIDSGVASCTESGVLYSRRMVRQERLSRVRSEAGKRGGASTAGLLKQNAKQNSSKRPSKTRANAEPSAGVGVRSLFDFAEGAAAAGASQEERSPPTPPSKEESIPPLPPQGGCPETAEPSSGQQPGGASGEALLTFPTDGKEKVWHLYPAKVSELGAAFPSLDVLAECRKALAWVQQNPDRRKTARGMGRFLFHWLSRAQDGGRAGKVAGAAAESTAERIARFRREAECSEAERNGTAGRHDTPPSSGSAPTPISG
jgi:hypothetical protein